MKFDKSYNFTFASKIEFPGFHNFQKRMWLSVLFCFYLFTEKKNRKVHHAFANRLRALAEV